MDTTLEIVLPTDLIALLGPQDQAAQAVKEYAIPGLFQEGRLSAGKSADLLGLTPRGFVALLARKGIDYFRFGPREWTEEAAAVPPRKPSLG